MEESAPRRDRGQEEARRTGKLESENKKSSLKPPRQRLALAQTPLLIQMTLRKVQTTRRSRWMWM